MSKGFFRTIFSVCIIGFGAVVIFALAGSFTPNPSDPSSSHYTLENIYSKITTGTEASSGAHSFNPSTIPAPTYHTLENIWNSITWRSLDNTGTIQAGFYATSSLLIADANLVSSKIATGTNIFGVEGGCVSMLTLLKQNLLVYYSLEDNSIDAMGTYNGVWNGVSSYVVGKLGQAASFNGSNYISAAGVPKPIDNWAISAWIKPSSLSTGAKTEPVVYNGNDYGGYGIMYYEGGFHILYGWIWGMPSFYTVTDLNVWYHVVATRVNGELRTYVNGVQSGITPTNDPNAPEDDFFIGHFSSPFGGYRNFNGSVDEVAFWNRSLSSSEVLTIYNNDSGRVLAP